jgi:hypothetical protein
MGETRVDLLHLLEDLRDAYPGMLEETILTEVVANSLDSGANRIVIHADPSDGTLIEKGPGPLSRYCFQHQKARAGDRFCRRGY